MDQPSRRFGRYEIVVLRDGFFEAPSDVLTHRAGDAARRDAIARWGKPTIGVDVNCFLLRDASGIILVDAGTGPSWGNAFGHARAALAAAGVRPDEVQHVLITHLHGDHALGLFDGDAPYFPRAQIHVPQVELDFFTDARARDALPEARRSGFGIASRLQALYDGRIKGIDAAAGDVLPDIAACPLPGHTPGHAGYLVKGGDRNLLFWGDALHLGALQSADPDIGLVYDLDSDTAARSRRTVLEQAVRDGWIVSGGHIAGFRQVEAAGDGFELVPA